MNCQRYIYKRTNNAENKTYLSTENSLSVLLSWSVRVTREPREVEHRFCSAARTDNLFNNGEEDNRGSVNEKLSLSVLFTAHEGESAPGLRLLGNHTKRG